MGKNSPAGKGAYLVGAGEEEYLVQNATQVPVVHNISLYVKVKVI